MNINHNQEDKSLDRRQDETEEIIDIITQDDKIKTGLLRKFALSITLLVLIISSVFFWFFQTTLETAVLNEFMYFYAEVAKQAASNIAVHTFPADIAKIKALLVNVARMERVAYIAWVGPKGESRCVQGKDAQGVLLPAGTDDYPPPGGVKHLLRSRPGLPTLHEIIVHIERPARENSSISAPVLEQDQNSSGFLRLGIDSGSGDNTFKKYSLSIIWFLILFVIFGVVLAWFLSAIIIHPIQKLAQAMKIVANEAEEYDETGMPMGRRFRRINDVDLKVHSQDEIGLLSDEFKIMMQKLEHAYQRLETIIKEKNQIVQEKSVLADNLRELNRKNEIIIKERTREVVEKNIRLYELFEELQFQKEDLISMNARLEKISQKKSEFLASMSHELRTPMNSIIGFAEILQDKMFGDLNERQAKYLSNILNSAHHLLQLINNILDISKVEAGKMDLLVEPYSINGVIDEVQSTIKTLAYKKNINMELKLGRDIVMQGDTSKIKQILYNLFSNAIKFTDEKGRIIIKTEKIPKGREFKGGAGAEPFTLKAPSVLLTVEDNGIGIKPEDQENIFKEFEQTEQTRRLKYEGTGLGLPLTRKLATLHQGHIWIESAFGKGTKVYVILPIKPESEDKKEQETRRV